MITANVTCDRCGKTIPASVNPGGGGIQTSENVSALVRQVPDMQAQIQAPPGQPMPRVMKLEVRHLCDQCLAECHSWIDQCRTALDKAKDRVKADIENAFNQAKTEVTKVAGEVKEEGENILRFIQDNQ